MLEDQIKNFLQQNGNTGQFGLPGGVQKNINKEHKSEYYVPDDVENQPLNNVILIGTKKDLCYDEVPVGRPQNQRRVAYSEAIDMCKRLRLSGCVETSNQYPYRYGHQGKDTFWDDLNDAVGQAACLCVDQTNRELNLEYSLMPQDGNLT